MFEGFSQDTLSFFAALQVNNNKPFFEENRQVYEQAVRKPLHDLVDVLAPVVLEIDPQLDIRPTRTVSRIHRDLRFGRNKTPYREYMWAGFRRVGESREETCGFYFDLSATSANWGCGFYHMNADTMRSFRNKLVKEPARVQKIINNVKFKASFQLMGDAYLRQHQPPEGMAPELGELYRRKAVYAEHHVDDMGELFSPGLADRIAGDFKTLGPFYTFLRECMVKRIEEVDA